MRISIGPTDQAAAVLALGLCLSSALVAAPASGHLYAQSGTTLFDALTQLRSEVATDRVRALAHLLSLGLPRTEPYNVSAQARALVQKYPEQDDPIIQALIAALEQENLREHSGQPGSLSETDTEYYADLIAAVGGLQDVRAATALAGALDTGGMASNGIAALGASGVPAVLNALRADSLRRSVPYVLQKMLSLGDAATANGIRSGLLEILNDPNPNVRIAAMPPLAGFPDIEVTRAVESIANGDPFTEIRNGEQVFPVRLAAQSWLRERVPR